MGLASCLCWQWQNKSFPETSRRISGGLTAHQEITYAVTSYIDDDVRHKRLLLCPSRQEDDGLSRCGWYGGRFSINGSLWTPARTGPADGKPPVYRFCGRVSSGTLRNSMINF